MQSVDSTMSKCRHKTRGLLFLQLRVFMIIHEKMLVVVGEESGECALETATASKEGSTRDYCPVLTEGGFCASFFYASLRCASALEVEMSML